MSAYKLRRKVAVDECPWLERDMQEGETVHQFAGHTYGCIGPGGIAVTTEPDAGAFFELPTVALRPVQDSQP